ncbi:uncharacterized protein LTR77_002191 [Saxophila tyrrhenica]|uniref:Uncharacterized protein n=1 Tax=Saxophila tyrrhenica TaxID=1690608 RepID=A0AAV9PIH2_9PEZI|nr:hypothetical protein LTR77_002191 [Saxophila tyrrhenica]
MGRLFHLERLALGRSPFESIDAEDSPPEVDSQGGISSPDNGHYQQQYDRKGRPINPATEKHNRELRHAQNAILELVGVVESKDQTARLEQERRAEERAMILHDEHDWGDTFESLGEARTRFENSTLFDEIPKVHPRRAQTVLNAFEETLCTAVDIALLPLHYHTWAHTLGLAPAWPLLPSWRILLPKDSLSLHAYVWRPVVQHGIFRHFTSPAVLMLCWAFLTRNSYPDACAKRYSPFNRLADFAYPRANQNPERPRDPLGRVLYQAALLRQKILRLLGYNLHGAHHNENSFRNDRPAEYATILYENNRRIDHRGRVNDEVYRSTALSLLAPGYLADCIDRFLVRLLLLPFENAMLRSITSSYLASPLPKTILAVSAATNYLIPGSNRLAPFGSWQFGTAYLSKLGLGLALYSAAEAGAFFVVWGSARWQGVEGFGWGRPQVLPIDGSGQESDSVDIEFLEH